MANQSPDIPTDKNQRPLPLTPAFLPRAVTYDATISSSTSISLNSATTLIEVTAIDKGVFLRWQANASNSNFDEYIGAGQTRHYVRPDNVSVVAVIEQAATGGVVVIEK